MWRQALTRAGAVARAAPSCCPCSSYLPGAFRAASTTPSSSPPPPSGGKTQAEIKREAYVRARELALDAKELRPLMAENAAELLREAEEAIPPGTGYRGHRRKKQQRIRLAIVRRQHAVRKEERLKKHEAAMVWRSAAAARARMEKIGVPLAARPSSSSSTTTSTETA